MENKRQNATVEIKHDMPPLHIVLKKKDGETKEYVLKITSNGSKLLLNRKEY